jgi:hypothetical protein
MKKSILIFIAVFTISFSAKAQDGFENILLANKADATKLMHGYFNPAMKGFIYSMNNGWYHTAKVHKVLGFDLTVGLSASMIPTKDEVFTVTGLTSISPSTITSSTLAGEGNGATGLTVSRTITVGGQPQTITAPLSLPEGIAGDLPLKAIPAPVAQINVGLPYKIEAMVRYFPETDFGDDGGKASMLGLGLKKEITSWFGPIDKLPLHVSLLAAYTSMDVNYGFPNTNANDPIQINNGEAAFSLKAYTVQAIASLNFPFINVYGGFGYSSGKATLDINGAYTGEYSYSAGGQTITVNETLSVPTDMEFDASGVKTTIGARISLGFFKIFADYTLQEYNTLSAGIALSIR